MTSWHTRFSARRGVAWLRTASLGWTIAALALIALPLFRAWSLIGDLKPLGMQEDALIGMRHLRHFVEHGRLVYNLDTHTLGATSPLFWLVSGLGYLPLHLVGLADDLLRYHYDFVFCCWAATLVGFVALGRGAVRVVIAAFAVIALSHFVYGLRFLYLGLEGPFLTLSMVAVFALVRARRPVPLVLGVCGVLAWDRPEIAIVAAPVLVLAALVHGGDLRARLRNLGGLTLGWGVPPLLMWILTGAAIPNTVRAKSYFGDGTAALRDHPLAFVRERLAALDAHVWSHSHASLNLVILVAASVVWTVIAAVRARRRGADPGARWWRAVLALFAAGYTAFILLVPNLWPWYVTYWMAFALIAIGVLVHDLAAWLVAVRPWPRPAVIVAGCAIAALGAGGYVVKRNNYARTHAYTIYWITQEAQLRGRLGRDLATRWHATSVWMEAAGWQGYGNEARVYDEVGLVDDTVFDLTERDGCGYFMAGMRTVKPQFVIKRRSEVTHNAIFTSPRVCPNAPLFVDDAARVEFFRHYLLVGMYEPTDREYFGELGHLWLFERVQ